MIDYQKILNNNLLNVFIDILKSIEKNGLDGSNHLYITFKTGNSHCIVPDWLLIKYPNENLIKQGVNKGDLISFKPDSEYEFEVDGEKLYRMFDHQITMIL